MNLLRLALLPFSMLYGLILWLRNKLYDWNILASQKPEIKTIVVGNLALGGTGKTPHIEYLLQLFSDKKVAVLSRGYGRKTTGTVFGTPQSRANEIGDEPLQIIKKFPNVILCVEADRIKGIQAINDKYPDIDLVILDDALQHRPLKGGFNILLTTFQRPFFKDYYLPAGTLRDRKIRARDADMIIVSKTPKNTEERELDLYRSKLAFLNKPVFFDHLFYQEYRGLNSKKNVAEYQKYIAVTGIAKPELFMEKLESEFDIVKHFRFPDHREFRLTDLELFRDFIGNFAPGKAAFLTTEKDAMRLLPFEEKLEELNLHFFYLPVVVEFNKDKIAADSMLRDYVYGTR